MSFLETMMGFMCLKSLTDDRSYVLQSQINNHAMQTNRERESAMKDIERFLLELDGHFSKHFEEQNRKIEDLEEQVRILGLICEHVTKVVNENIPQRKSSEMV